MTTGRYSRKNNCDKFVIGARVRLSASGLREGIDGRKSGSRSGTILGLSKRANCVRIYWDGTKRTSSHIINKAFLQIVRS